MAPHDQRPGNVFNFKNLQLVIFSGTEKPLDTEKWLINTINLMKAAQISNENQVKVAKIQLKNVARSWWLA